MKGFWVGVLGLWAANCWAGSTDEVLEAVSRSGLDLKVESVKPSPIAGLHQVQLENGRVIYASPDGRYLLQGAIYEVQEKGVSNLTASLEKANRASFFGSLPEEEMIVYRAKDQKAYITVFTDVECPFCHKLHEDIKALNAEGITVRYLAYPRQGLASPAYKSMVSVWCAKNRISAMDDAVDGDDVGSEDCQNPVAKHYELGRQMGVQGTPTIVFQDGSLVTGYRAVKEVKSLAVK